MATPGSCADSSVHAAWRYTVSTVGFRYHLPNLNAALGLAQLDQRNHMCERKCQVVARYDEAFQERPGLALVTHDPNHTSPFFYVLRVLDGRRASMMRYLADRGVGSSVHYIPNHLQPLFTAADQPALPRTERLFGEIMTLPLFADITDGEVDTVVAAVRSFAQ